MDRPDIKFWNGIMYTNTDGKEGTGLNSYRYESHTGYHVNTNLIQQLINDKYAYTMMFRDFFELSELLR